MNNLYIGQIKKISKKKLGLFLALADGVRYKPEAGKSIYMDGLPYKIENSVLLINECLINLAGINEIGRLYDFVGKAVYAPVEDFTVKSYSHDDLKGCEVITSDGRALGLVAAVLKTKAHDILEVRSGQKEYLIPFKKVFIKEIDIENKIVRIEPIEGLLE